MAGTVQRPVELAVPFELGHDEIGSTQQHDLRIADDIIELFDIIGLESPDPIPLLALDHQIAQKLHACTAISAKTGGDERAHDLVDLQILEQEEDIDYAALDATARRLFNARRSQPWPPTVVAYDRWDTIYALDHRRRRIGEGGRPGDRDRGRDRPCAAPPRPRRQAPAPAERRGVSDGLRHRSPGCWRRGRSGLTSDYDRTTGSFLTRDPLTPRDWIRPGFLDTGC
jgi:hypothetical protein